MSVRKEIRTKISGGRLRGAASVLGWWLPGRLRPMIDDLREHRLVLTPAIFADFALREEKRGAASGRGMLVSNSDRVGFTMQSAKTVVTDGNLSNSSTTFDGEPSVGVFVLYYRIEP